MLTVYKKLSDRCIFWRQPNHIFTSIVIIYIKSQLCHCGWFCSHLTIRFMEQTLCENQPETCFLCYYKVNVKRVWRGIDLVIDFHTHCFPDQLADKAVTSLSAKAGIPACWTERSATWKRSMEANCITGSVLLNIATKPSQAMNINNWATQVQDEDVISFGSIHPLCEDWVNELSD